jgi:2-oxoglutarate dehydrogenase E2 component (dihydrolipoamide succinyltransferase)
MARVELVMPKMGESVMEGTILKWLKNIGDKIEQDEAFLEVATDKVDTEVPSTHAGTLVEMLAKDGEVVQVGKAIAVIETSADVAVTAAPVASAPVAAPAPSVTASSNFFEQTASATPANTATLSAPASGRFYSPLVLNIAREEGIGMAELDVVPGTGKEGRVSKKDILDYVQAKKSGKAAPVVQPVSAPVTQPQQAAPATTTAQSAPAPAISFSGRHEIIEMDRMRKMIAERMVDSKRTSPHVTSFVEADVTNMVMWRNKIKNEFFKREGDNITFTPLLIEAVVKAIKDYPMINISVNGTQLIVKKDINIGMAVALPSGNLIVPVIKGADQMNLIGLSRAVNDLARRARENKLKADDLEGGTYTISNVGSFGNVMGTPIIVQPQVGILALGAIRKKPAVIETPQGDTIGIRHMMFLSHSYDHRVVDGALGGMFVRRVADYLEQFDLNKEL